MIDRPAAIESPCIKVCAMEPATGLCRGCGRSLDEIAAWTAMPQAARARVMADLPGRLARMAAGRAR